MLQITEKKHTKINISLLSLLVSFLVFVIHVSIIAGCISDSAYGYVLALKRIDSRCIAQGNVVLGVG